MDKYFWRRVILILNFIVILVIAIAVKGCMASDAIVIETIAYEASGESLEGQIGVATVILNRARERRQTLETVCLAKKQFSCWENSRPTQNRILTDTELLTASKALEIARNRSRISYERNKANIYMRKELMRMWLREGLLSGKVVKLYTEGNHAFYYERR